MIEKGSIKNCFDSAAASYDSVAKIQKETSEDLATFVDKFFGNNSIYPSISSILDIGCGTGNTSQEFLKKYPSAKITLCDISPKMLEVAAQKICDNSIAKKVCCDAEYYDFREHYDLAVSNLSIQWFSNIQRFTTSIQNYCDIFAFSTLTNGAFERYRELFEVAPVFNYPSAEELLRTIPMVVHYQVKKYTLRFENYFSVVKYFRRLGAYLKLRNPKILKTTEINSVIFLDYEVFFGIQKNH